MPKARPWRRAGAWPALHRRPGRADARCSSSCGGIDVEGARARPRHGRGDHLPQPHLGARLVLPARSRCPAASPTSARPSTWTLEDEVPLPGPRHDPDRPRGRQRQRAGARRRGPGARRGRAVRHLPRGHPVARRPAPRGHTGVGPPRAAHRRARSSRSASSGTARGAAARRDGAPARSGRSRIRFGRPIDVDALPRPRRRPPGAAPDHRRGHVRDPRPVGPGVRRRVRHQEGRRRPGRAEPVDDRPDASDGRLAATAPRRRRDRRPTAPRADVVG